MSPKHIQSPASPQTNENQSTKTPSTETQSNGPARLGSLAASVGADARRGGLTTVASIQMMQKTYGNQATMRVLQRQQEGLRNRKTNDQDDEVEDSISEEQDASLEEETSPIIPDLGNKMYDEIINKKIKPIVKNAVWEKAVEAFMHTAQRFATKLFPDFALLVQNAIYALNLFTEVTKFWREMNPNVRAGVKFMVGVVVNKLETSLNGRVMLISRYESLAADDAQTSQLTQTLVSILEKVETFATYTKMSTIIKWLSGSNKSDPKDEVQEEQHQADGEQENDTQPDAPKLHTLDLKLIKLDMQDLTIAKTEGVGKDRKKGGLDSKNKVTIRLFEKEYVVDEIHARLDWDFLLSIDGTLMNKLITARTEFLIFEIENLILDKLTVGNDGLKELGVSIGKFKAGQLLEIDSFTGGYARDKGFHFDINQITLNLPDPLPKVQTGAKLLLDAKGGFKSLALEQFQVGSNFEVKYAQFTKEHLLIQEAAYTLTYKNSTFKPMLNELLVTKDRGIERVSGGISVEKFKPLDGLMISGQALVGYEGDKKKFYLSINGTQISLDYGLIQGYGDIELLKLYQDGEFTGAIKDLNFSIGKFSFNARNVNIDPNGVLTADEAEVVLGDRSKRKNTDEDMKEIGATDEDKDSFGTSISMKAKKIKIEKGKLSVEKYEKSLNLNNVYKINLFGGGIHGVLDPKKEKASVTGKIGFPGKRPPFWPLSLSVGVPIPPTPLMVFAKVEIGGGITATASGEVARDQSRKEESIYDLSMKAKIEAELGFSIAGGLKIGSEFIVALRAYLQAATNLKATAVGELNGRIKFDRDKGQAEQDESDPLELKYKLQAELKAKIEAVMDFIAFLTYNKQLASKTLGEWTLGSYVMEGSVGEKDGEITDSVETPKQSGEDDTLGGAIPGKIKQPDNHIIRELIQGSELTEEKYLYRNAHDLLSDKGALTQESVADVKLQLNNALSKNPTFKNQKKVSETVDAAVRDLTHRQNAPTQSHLMSVDEWIRYSSNGDERKSILKVDEKLKNYHIETNLDRKIVRLNDLRKAIKTYCDGGFDFTRGRKSMASKLLLDTNPEHDMLLEQKKQVTATV